MNIFTFRKTFSLPCPGLVGKRFPSFQASVYILLFCNNLRYQIWYSEIFWWSEFELSGHFATPLIFSSSWYSFFIFSTWLLDYVSNLTKGWLIGFASTPPPCTPCYTLFSTSFSSFLLSIFLHFSLFGIRFHSPHIVFLPIPYPHFPPIFPT